MKLNNKRDAKRQLSITESKKKCWTTQNYDKRNLSNECSFVY